MSGFSRAAITAVAALSILILSSAALAGEDETALVEEAQITMQHFTSDPNMGSLLDLIPDAEGVLIVPALYKAGFLIGGSGGQGVLLARDEDTGGWLGPAFYNLGGASGGLQAGVERAEVVILAMTRDAVEDMLGSTLKLGVDASVAAGPVGAGAEASTTPMPSAAFISFSRSQGVYAGLTLEGSALRVDDDSNEHYYGTPVRPMDILIRKKTGHDNAARGLIDALRQAEMAGQRDEEPE